MRLPSYKQLGSSMPSFSTYFIYKPHQCLCLRVAWELHYNVRRWKYGWCLLCGVTGTGGHFSVCLRVWLRYLTCTNWRKSNVTQNSLHGFTTMVKRRNTLIAIIMSTSHGGRFNVKLTDTISYQTIVALWSFQNKCLEWRLVVSIW